MNDTEKMSYALGMNVAGNICELPLEIDNTSFVKALETVLAGKEPELSQEEYAQNMQKFQQEVQAAGQKAMKAAADQNRAAGEEFLAANAKKEGVKTTASGLQYQVLTEGNGPKPTKDKKVRVHYTGSLIDGKVFDSSVQRGEPAEFGLTQVIAGWTEGLQLMSVGSKYRFFIPAGLAYGDRGAPGAIPPCAALIFDVELLAIL